MNFEVHVTVPRPAASSIQTELESLAESLRWKTSTIDGDPKLGKGPRFYFTKHFGDYTDALVMMNMLAQRLQQCGIIVLRKKIELVMYDKVNTDPEIPAEQRECETPRNEMVRRDLERIYSEAGAVTDDEKIEALKKALRVSGGIAR